MFSLELEEGWSLTCDVLVPSITKIFRVKLKVTLSWFQNSKLVSIRRLNLIPRGSTDWCEGLVIGFKSSRSHRLWREPVSIIFLTALLKKLERFISQVAWRPGAHVTILSAPGSSQNSVAGSPSSWQADRNVLVLFPNKLVSFGKGTACLWCDRIARQPTLSYYCLDSLCLLTSLTPWTFLLVKRRIRVSFTDYSSMARSTCVWKEGIVETDVCGNALSGCWAKPPGV